jgi:predicted Zn-dependent peptidase
MLDRKTPPPYSQNNTLTLLEPRQVNLTNGATLFFIHGGDQQVVKIELVFPAGRWFEDFPGISYFTVHLLPKGTETKNSKEIAQAFESLGIHLEITPGYDFVLISLFGLTKRIKDALSLLVEICSRPAFPEEEIIQFKNIFLQNLKINREKTSYLAGTAFRENLFGKNHPYGSEVNEGFVKKITSQDLKRHHSFYYKSFTGFITGKIPETLVNQVTESLNLLSYAFVPECTIPDPVVNDKLIKLEKPGSVQASLRLGKMIIPRNHPDYPGLLLASHVLGGYFGSRLMQRLREEMGLTYGIHSVIHPLMHKTYFVISTDVNNEHRDDAVDEIVRVMKNFRTSVITEYELTLAKNHFLGTLFTEINTPFAHTEKLKNIYLNNLDKRYYQILIEKIQHTSSDSLMQLAEEYLHEKALLIVSAG